MRQPSDLLLKVEGVGLEQGRFLLLQEISFELRRGDRIALVGLSGSGKSLLFRLLNGLISPTHGNIWLQDAKIETLDPSALRRRVVWVSDPPRLFSMTVQEAIAYPLQLQSLSAQQIQVRLNAALELLEISDADLGKTEQELEPAALWRVAIARAWVMQPELLLLDYPGFELRPSASNPASAQLQHSLERVIAQLQAQGSAVVMALRGEQVGDEWTELNRGKSSLEEAPYWSRLLHLGRSRLTPYPASNDSWSSLHQALRDDRATAQVAGDEDWPEEEI